MIKLQNTKQSALQKVMHHLKNIRIRKRTSTKSHNEGSRSITKRLLGNDNGDLAIRYATQQEQPLVHEKDILDIIVNTPNDPKIYLHVGRRYIDQGLEEYALDIFIKGLTNVVHDTHPDYMMLLQEKRMLDDRVDFFARAPADIVYHVIDLMDQDSVAQCSLVSTIWRALVLNYPKPWRSIQVKSSDKFTGLQQRQQLAAYKMLASISCHVHELILSNRGTRSLKYLDLIRTSNFTNLCSLKIKSTDIRWSPDIKHYYADIGSALTSVSNTLVSLTLTFLDKNGMPSIWDIISTCRNLTYLRLNHLVTTSSPHFPLLLETTSLTTFILDEDLLSNTAMNTCLEKLFQLSPHLHCVSIFLCEDDIYELVTRYCSNLKVLTAGWLTLRWEKEIEGLVSSKNSGGDGLQWLTIRLNVRIKSDNTISYVEQNEATLRRLWISCDSRMNHMDYWRRLSACSFDKLTHFALERFPLIAYSYLNTILKKISRHLEYFRMTGGSDNPIPQSIFNILKKMSTLHNLSLVDFDADPHHLQEFLEAHVEMKEASPLHNLEICFYWNMNDDIAITCTRIQSLSTLTIGDDFHTGSTSTKKFMYAVARQFHITFLALVDLDMTVENLKIISSNKAIKELKLMTVRGISKVQVDDIFSTKNVHVTFLADNDLHSPVLL